MKSPYIYSPLDPSDFQIPTTDRCETSSILSIENSEARAAAWNLFWLSNPAIDAMPNLGIRWWESYQPVVGEIHGRRHSLVGKVIEDVYKDVVLRRKLVQHPRRFLVWWLSEDVTIYDTHMVVGPKWREIVEGRAQQAAERLEAVEPSVVDGNVIFGAWPRRA